MCVGGGGGRGFDTVRVCVGVRVRRVLMRQAAVKWTPRPSAPADISAIGVI